MPATPIQTSFSAGEISKHLRGQVGSSIFQRGLDRCENYWPFAHGPLASREPSLDCGALPDDPLQKFARVRMSDGQDFVLVFTDRKMRMWSVATGEEQIVTGRDLSTSGDFSSTAGWIIRDVPDTAFDAHGEGYIGGGECVLSTYDFPGSPVTPVYIWSKQLRQEIVTDQPYSGTLYVKVRSFTGGKMVESPYLSSLRFVVAIETGNGSGMITKQLFTPQENGEQIEVPFVMPAGATTLNINLYLSTEMNVNVPITACRCEIDDVAVVVDRQEGFEIDTPWVSSQLSSLQWDTETAQDHTVFVNGEVDPWSLRYDSRGGGFWQWRKIDFLGAPGEWASTKPEAVQFHDGRLYLSVRNKLWGSRVGSPFDFRRRTDMYGNPTDEVNGDTGITPECSVQRNVATKGAIRWMQSGKVLLLGTDITEHAVTSQSGISPTDIHVNTESWWGSAKKMSVDAGSHVLYVSADGTKVRAINYSSDSEGWVSRDITFIGDLTEVGIKELHYSDGIILALLETGTFAACAYKLEPGNESVGWWRLMLGGSAPEVITAAVSVGSAGKFVWMAVSRPNGIRMERMSLKQSAGDVAYLDSYRNIPVPIPPPGEMIDHLDGLEHLNGEQVRVVINGVVADPKGLITVVDGRADITPINEAPGAAPGPILFTVGLPYKPSATLLPKEMKSGKVHNAKIGIHVLDSAVPLINGKRPKDRTPSTGFDRPEPRRTGKLEVANLGWDGEGKLTIESDLPFRSEILAVYTTTAREET